MDYPIRPITNDELIPFFEARAAGFGEEFRPEGIEHTRRYADFTRTVSAWDEDQVVGTTGTWTFNMSVPGGDVHCAGVTWVSVRATHRRKGILTAMMRHQLNDVRERGEPIAMLWASEMPIYGRFGYGLTAEGVEMRIDRTRTALASAVRANGRTRFVSRDQALAHWPSVYAKARARFPAMHSRSAAWWEHRVLREPETRPDGYGPSYFVQYEEDGAVLGYVRYRVKEHWADGGVSASQLAVVELVSTTDAAYSALWQFVFSVDLVGTIEAEWRHTDEPLYHMLADSRRLIRRPTDTVFCRIVDPVAALSARRYSVPGEIILEVTDPFCPWVAGKYLIEGGPDGALCTPTTRSADITLGATELGAIYMGGTPLAPLFHAGRLCGTDPAIRRAEAMFRWSPAPWAPEIW